MKRIIVCLCIVVGIACNRTDKKFLITDTHVGMLSKGTQVSQLDSLYQKDSLVNSAFEGELRYADNERIAIFEKGGVQLLELTPKLNDKNTKVVESIQILDPRFTTDKGISLSSSFKDIKSAYPDLELQQTLKSLIITPKDHSFYFIMDKSEINKPSLGISDKVTLEDIPSTASIKYIMLNWD